MKRPLGLAALVALATLATTSGCGPRWTLDDRSSTAPITIDAGQSASAVVDIEASHPIASVRTVAENISVDSGRIHVTQEDPRSGCTVDAVFVGSEGLWNREPKTNDVNLTQGHLELSSQCGATEHAAKITVRFTNEGKLPVTFGWRLVATTSGEGGSDPPDDAFIRVRVE